MIMEAVKRNVCRGVIFLMACLTCVVVFGSGLIAKATNYSPYAPYTTYACDLGINVTKELVGRPFQAGDAFTFKIEPKDGAPAPVDKSGNELKTVTIVPTDGAEEGQTAETKFDATFTFDWPGKYVYYIFEDQPEKPLEGITYDQTIYRLTIEIAKEIPVQTDTSGRAKPPTRRSLQLTLKPAARLGAKPPEPFRTTKLPLRLPLLRTTPPKPAEMRPRLPERENLLPAATAPIRLLPQTAARPAWRPAARMTVRSEVAAKISL